MKWNPQLTTNRISQSATTTAVAAITILISVALRTYGPSWWKKKKKQTANYEELIGNTPLVHLSKLSSLVSNTIHVKMECCNPGGTGKDRAALFMLRDAEKKGLLPQPLSSSSSFTNRKNSITKHDDSNDPITVLIERAIEQTRTGGIVIEGTSGSTGISLATLCTQRGHSFIVILPSDQASYEKQTILKCLGAIVHIVPNVSISNPNHYINIAKRITKRISSSSSFGEIKAVFMNQFENESNYQSHYQTTGPEIWNQTCGEITTFCMSCGTGGTIAGVGNYLKEHNPNCKVVVIDPPGSVVYNKVKYNVAYVKEQQERQCKTNRYDTIVEGIGLDRMTHNLQLGEHILDDALCISDQEAIDMAHWLLREEGLFVGSSAAMNIMGAVQIAISKKSNNGNNQCGTIVTVLCDGGQRHLSKFWNRDFVVQKWKLKWPEDDLVAWKKRLPF